MTLDAVFTTHLPERLATYCLPEGIRAGEIHFIAQGPNPVTWSLHAAADGDYGVRFMQPAPSTPSLCTVTMAAQDYVQLAQGALNLQMAFMQGRLKVGGDVGRAMQLGALFG